MSRELRKTIPLIDWFRTIGRGRERLEALRFPDTVAARTQPPPHVPGGPYHKISKIYYYTRDVRRSVQPPSEIYTEGQIEAGKIDMTQVKLNPLNKKLISEK
ncbi:NADH dehydrogenase [ubiquinone] 1 alpha subcomplex subunit 7-like [Bombus pascuorum]|uniref:NADH dehydrogenase [ubiquinone] 1 alpha subcomplex subunit 7-like n=1 Tax=Bombus pascuorum TaxID=65598 RepID=UPI00298DC286|nr:NADH dehydrogenase [ubiquinone] 1 alpha subcomplex subunit 7-like [Bombus pascuorum]